MRIREVNAALKGIVSEKNLLTKDVDRFLYSYDAGTLWRQMPGCVVFPETVEQISKIMKLACRYGVPVTPRGAGTNQSGGSIPAAHGIVICFSRMNRIIEIDERNLTATVEPGVVLHTLNTALAKKGLYFPPDPQSFFAATMGGIISENSGGPVCLKYGVTKQYVAAMTVVLPEGQVLDLGGLTMNNFYGYDLLTLMVGSEGTLGIVARATVRLLRLPPAKKTVAAAFDHVATAGEAVQRIIARGVIPAKSELIDNWVIQKIEAVSPVGFPLDAEAIILFETDGTEASTVQEAQIITDICLQCGATWARPAKDQCEADKFWAARRAGFATAFSSAPTLLAEDVVVPLKHIPALLKGIKEISAKHDIVTFVMGHAGDGNMHPDILTDKNDPEWYQRAEKVLNEIIELALSLDGVISGEHGIGLEKKEFIGKSLDPAAVMISKQIKRLFDPYNIMNPDKIWS